MKKNALKYLLLILCVCLFSTKIFAQGLPDPGNDPLKSPDSAKATPSAMPSVAELPRAIIFTHTKNDWYSLSFPKNSTGTDQKIPEIPSLRKQEAFHQPVTGRSFQ